MEDHQTIGIIGGGQLGRMLTLAALPLGFEVVVLHPHAGSPASLAGAREIVGDYYDESAIKRLAEQSDYLTIEIEHVDAITLEYVEKLGKPVNPSPRTIQMIQDKFAQKEFLSRSKIAVAPYRAIENLAEARQALADYGGKMLLKTRYGAYDGRGNALIENESMLESAYNQFKGVPLYAEQFVSFKKEIAVMVARTNTGAVMQYPVVETIHKRNICLEVLAPARVSQSIRSQTVNMVREVASLFEGAGVFGIELFLTEDDHVLVNEIAPRVHNSGHYTIEACRTSQFEQHIRAITGLPLGVTDMLVQAAVMVNILGERDGPTELVGLEKVLAYPSTSLHWYGKSPTKIDRKMGHITSTGHSLGVARSRAEAARKELQI